jgi:hypothetical protein
MPPYTPVKYLREKIKEGRPYIYYEVLDGYEEYMKEQSGGYSLQSAFLMWTGGQEDIGGLVAELQGMGFGAEVVVKGLQQGKTGQQQLVDFCLANSSSGSGSGGGTNSGAAGVRAAAELSCFVLEHDGCFRKEQPPTEWDIFVALDSYDSNDIGACVHMYANNRICVLNTDTVAEVKQKIARQLPQLLVEGTACVLTDPNEIDGALADEYRLVGTSLRDGSVVVCQQASSPPPATAACATTAACTAALTPSLVTRSPSLLRHRQWSHC